MHTGRKLALAVFGTACITFAYSGSALADTLTFDELGSPTPVDGLSVKGVTFDFKIDGVDSTDAIYNQSFPPQLPPNLFVNLQAPILEGNATGILSLDFAQPISELQFAVGVESLAPVSSALSVELFAPDSNSLGITSVNTSKLAILSEGSFAYSGVPVQKAVLNFDQTKFGLDPSLDPRFSVDNLSYTAVPEPSSLLGLFAIGAYIGVLRLKHSSSK